MFTGLVQSMGRVEQVTATDAGARLVIDASAWDHHAEAGESIAVAGCCLTHAPKAGDPPAQLVFDVVAETLAKTTLGDLAPGDRVNLEACLRASDLLGGHVLQGHIDAVGTVANVQKDPSDWRLKVKAGPDQMPLLVPKGSVAIDGVSLTIAEVDRSACVFTVALIPTTLQLTTLGELADGDRVNLETDVLVRAVVNWLENHGPRG